MAGVAPDTIIGKSDHQLFAHELADRHRANDAEVIRSAAPNEFVEFGNEHDGEHIFLSVKFPIRGSDGAVVGVGGIATDITRRDRERRQLERLATIVRDANDAITEQGFDGVIAAWNPAAERIYGWSETEALGMNVLDLVSEADRPTITALMQRVRDGEKPAPVEVTRLTRNGQTVRMRVTCCLLWDEFGKPRALATTEQPIV